MVVKPCQSGKSNVRARAIARAFVTNVTFLFLWKCYGQGARRWRNVTNVTHPLFRGVLRVVTTTQRAWHPGDLDGRKRRMGLCAIGWTEMGKRGLGAIGVRAEAKVAGEGVGIVWQGMVKIRG